VIFLIRIFVAKGYAKLLFCKQKLLLSGESGEAELTRQDIIILTALITDKTTSLTIFSQLELDKKGWLIYKKK